MTEPTTAPWPSLEGKSAQVLPGGLINATWRVGDPPLAVVQRINPIFGPEVHEDIEAVTAHLEGAGIMTPRLLRTSEGQLFAVDEAGACWRAMTWVPGTTLHRLGGAARARSAGAFVARWHRAVSTLDHAFVHRRLGVHDTRAHMTRLVEGLVTLSDRRLFADVEPLACEILAQWAGWEGSLELPERVSHGDLKISNLRFDADGTAVCLLDLDTLGTLTIDAELGDAWRSWCNPAGEDAAAARLDLTLFEAAVMGYLGAHGLTAEEREGLVAGVERIALELASRFAIDALEERYFGFDPDVAPTRGDHNLMRARGQLNLAQSVAAQRSALEAAVRSAALP